MINGFNELTIQSTFNNSAYYDSEKDDAESDPNSDPKVYTYTTNENYPQKLFINRLIPEIIWGSITPIHQTITEDDAGIRETFEACQTIILKEIGTDAARRGARIFRTPVDVSRNGQGRHHATGQKYRCRVSTRLTSPVRIYHSTTKSPSRPGNQEPTPLTQPTELTEHNGKAHIPDDLDPNPSFSY